MSGLRDKANEAQVALECDGVKTRLAASQRELASTRRRLTVAERELVEAQAILERYAFVKADDARAPKWLKPTRAPKGKHHATPVLLLSDLHLDEVVDLAEMDGINAYDRAIAEKRLERVAEGVVKLLRQYVAGVTYDGLLLAILGDIITGEIHDELARTNEAPPSASIAYWVPKLAAFIKYLADELDVPVHVPCVDGNHDRTYRKTPKKKRAESSLAWIIYNWLADILRDDDRITFSITTSPEQLIDVYDTTLLLSHGDGFRSAGGVGGLYPSMLKWLLRKHQLYSATKRDFDIACIGHWHQDLYGQDFVVNASLKGYDEYAKDAGFSFGVAAQQLFTITPERGLVQRLTVFAD